MGREWNWGRRSSRRGADSAEKEKQQGSSVTPAGCISGMLHLFDLQQLLFTTRTGAVGGSTDVGGAAFPIERKDSSSDAPRGVEAPRNSLEMDVAAAFSGPLLGADDFEIPFGIQIAPRKAFDEEDEEEKRRRSSLGSSSARSANVVAKLMGLDLLPDRPSSTRTNWSNHHNHESFLSPSPARSHPNHHHQKRRKHQHEERRFSSSSSGSQTPPPRHPLQPRTCNAIVTEVRSGTRSLPETPRMSLARRSWDSDPRHSAQCYGKENLTPSAVRELKSICEDYASLSPSPPPPPPVSMAVRERRRDLITSVVEEGRSSTSSSSPGHYVSEIVRQFKDSVARRISGDSPVRGERRGRRSIEENRSNASSPRCAVILESPRSKAPPAPPPGPEGDLGLIVIAPQEQVPKPMSKLKPSRPPPLPPPAAAATQASCKQPRKAMGMSGKCKKAGFERFTERLKKPPPARKEALIAPPPPSCAPQPQKRQRRSPLLPATTNVGITSEREKTPAPPQPPRSPVPMGDAGGPLDDRSGRRLGSNDEELHYIRRVLEKAGVGRSTSLPGAVMWHSLSHPLDPIIFHQLELSPSSTSHHTISGPLRHRCNRKLLFHLANELLADILWPHHVPATLPLLPLPPAAIDSDALLRQLWAQIGSYPAANCQVRQDIDALVELDLPSTNIRRLLQHPAVAEEAEAIAADLERSLLDSLVNDSISAAMQPLPLW